MNDDLLSMRFDQYQRYRLVADVLDALREDGRPLQVLDVGGRTALLRRFVADPIVLVDVEPSQEAGLVLASGSRLPFQDGSFDVVAAFDTLEHVPVEGRRAFVRECLRVARRHVVLAGPYDAPEVVEAERLLQRFMLEKLGEHNRHLDEHIDYGLPELRQVQADLEAGGARVVSIQHANLHRWLVTQCVAFYMDYDPALHGLAAAFNRFYNRELYASDHAAPVYRHVVVAALGDAPLPVAADLLDPPVAPAGTIGQFVELAGELTAFDRERSAWREERRELREERERLLKVIADLNEGVEGHRVALEASRAELEGLRAAHAPQARPARPRGLWSGLKRVLGARRED